MRYLNLNTNSIQFAEMVNMALWCARYPTNIRHGNEVTNKYCGHIVHPVSGLVALSMPDQVIPVHPQRDVQPLIDVLTTGMPQEIIDAVNSHFASFDWENTVTTIENLLPSVFASQLLTQEQVMQDGWLENDY